MSVNKNKFILMESYENLSLVETLCVCLEGLLYLKF